MFAPLDEARANRLPVNLADISDFADLLCRGQGQSEARLFPQIDRTAVEL